MRLLITTIALLLPVALWAVYKARRDDDQLKSPEWVNKSNAYRWERRAR